MKRSDYYDRSYDFSEIEDDPRLRNAAKEMHITFWAYAAYVFVTLTVTYLTLPPITSHPMKCSGAGFRPTFLCFVSARLSACLSW